MYKSILIATDGSDLSNKAVAQGLALAKALSAKATAVCASEPWTAGMTGDFAIAFPVDQYERTVEGVAARNLAKVESEAASKASNASFDMSRMSTRPRRYWRWPPNWAAI